MQQELSLPLGQSVTLVTREGWGAEPSEASEFLRLPVFRVRFTYTAMAQCSEPSECAARVRELQQFYKGRGLPDLPYNFLVGGDGTVYEAGGWRVDTEKPSGHFWRRGKTVSIAYMGNFKVEGPPYGMISVALDLVKYGIKEKMIHPLCKLVGVKAEHSKQ